MPRALIAVFYIVAAPVARGLGFPSLMALFLAILFVLIHFELGYLLFRARKNGSALGSVVLSRNRDWPERRPGDPKGGGTGRKVPPHDAVGCRLRRAGSGVRRMLGVETGWRDYGTDSAVADFEMKCDLPMEVSRIVLDPERPYGFFYFAPGRWRLIYRLNEGEDRKAMTTEGAATELLESKLPGARIDRFLWASAFRLGQGQSEAYRKGRWLLCGDAAHAMGPSAGAGMMIGVLGAWRLGWRLALAAKADPLRAGDLLDGYEREQRVASEAVQNANATLLRELPMSMLSCNHKVCDASSSNCYDPSSAVRQVSAAQTFSACRRMAKLVGGAAAS